MPRCSVHTQEDLEPKRKGWFCEECGAIVLGYDAAPSPDEVSAGEQPPALSDAVASSEEVTKPQAPVSGDAGTGEPGTSELGTWGTLVSSSRKRARATVEAVRRLRRSPGLYVERAWFDETASAAAKREGRALLVLGEPGMGKTAWACKWVSEALASGDDEGDAVVLIAGAEGWRGERDAAQGLWHAISRAAAIAPARFASLGDWLVALESQGAGARRLIIVLDGVEQAPDAQRILLEVDSLLGETARYGWLRVVITMQRAYYEAAGEHGPGEGDVSGPFHNARHLVTFFDVATRRRYPYVEVRPWRQETEARSAYEVMQRSSPETSASFRWDKLTAPIRQLLCTPWCLDVFHDAFAGVDEAPSSLDALGLMQSWFSTLERAAPGTGALLDEIGSAAMHARHLNVIESALEAWGNAHGLAAIDALQAAGLLSKTTFEGRKPVWQLRTRRTAEAVLARELVRRIAPRVVPSSDLLLTWAKNAGRGRGVDAFPELVGALELLVARWVGDGECGFVPALLDVDQDEVRTRLVNASLRALGPCWGDQARGGPAALRLLEVISSTLGRPERARRLVASGRSSVAWLLQRGYSSAAAELSHRLVALAPSLSSRLSDAQERKVMARAWCALAQDSTVTGHPEDARKCVEIGVRAGGDSTASSRNDVGLARIHGMLVTRAARLSAADSELSKGRKSAEEALRAARRLVEVYPEHGWSHRGLIDVLVVVASIALRAGDLIQARACAAEADAMARAATPRFALDTELRRSSADACIARAEVHRAEQEPEAARDMTDAALRTMRKLVRAEPQRVDYRLDLAGMLDAHGSRLLSAGDDDLARRALDEGAGLMIALAEAHPEQTAWLHRVSHMLVTLGLVLRMRGESSSSRACFEEAVRHARSYVARGGSVEARGDLIMALNQLGHLEESQQRRSEARRAFREAVELVRGLERSPVPFGEPPRLIAMLLTALARLAAGDGDIEGARWHLTEATKELSAWLALHPGRIGVQSELCHVMSVGAGLAADGVTHQSRPSRYRFSVSVRERGGPEAKEYFDRDEITIGRAPGNDLMIPNYSVSRHHAIVRWERGTFTVLDLGSRHGTRVNGARITGRSAVAPGDRVDLGDFELQFEPAPLGQASEPGEEEQPVRSNANETIPPPPGAADAHSAPHERKEITIDLDVADFVEVVDKAEEAS